MFSYILTVQHIHPKLCSSFQHASCYRYLAPLYTHLFHTYINQVWEELIKLTKELTKAILVYYASLKSGRVLQTHDMNGKLKMPARFNEITSLTQE